VKFFRARPPRPPATLKGRSAQARTSPPPALSYLPHRVRFLQHREGAEPARRGAKSLQCSISVPVELMLTSVSVSARRAPSRQRGRGPVSVVDASLFFVRRDRKTAELKVRYEQTDVIKRSGSKPKGRLALVSSDDIFPSSFMKDVKRDSSSDVSESLSRLVERVEDGDESLERKQKRSIKKRSERQDEKKRKGEERQDSQRRRPRR